MAGTDGATARGSPRPLSFIGPLCAGCAECEDSSGKSRVSLRTGVIAIAWG